MSATKGRRPSKRGYAEFGAVVFQWLLGVGLSIYGIVTGPTVLRAIFGALLLLLVAFPTYLLWAAKQRTLKRADNKE